MVYKRKITDEQAKKVEDKLKNGMNVLIENGTVMNAQLATIKDILIEKEIVTEKDFDDRTYDKLYEILSITKLI